MTDPLIIRKNPAADAVNPMDAIELEKRVRPIFAGFHPAAKGSCLASMTALFIAGHMVKDDAKASARIREGLLAMHMNTIREMLPEAERQIKAMLEMAQAEEPEEPKERLN